MFFTLTNRIGTWASCGRTESVGWQIVFSGCAKNDNSPKMAASGGKDILCASPSGISRDKILSDFPLHWHVWHKDSSSLEEELALNKVCVRACFVHLVFTASRENRRHVLCSTINSFFRLFVVYL